MIEKNYGMALFSTLVSLAIIVSFVYRDVLQMKIAQLQEWWVK